MANLYDRINRANDKAGAIDYRLGDPTRKQLLIRLIDRSSGYQEEITDTLITPPPVITKAPPKLLGLLIGNEQTGITVGSDDFIATVSRSYDYSTFVRSDNGRVVVFINPRVTEGQVEEGSGTKARIIHVDDRDCCHWRLILRKDKD